VDYADYADKSRNSGGLFFGGFVGAFPGGRQIFVSSAIRKWLSTRYKHLEIATDVPVPGVCGTDFAVTV